MTHPSDRERGAAATEYGLLVAGIAALVVMVIYAFHGSITTLFEDTCSSISARAATSTC